MDENTINAGRKLITNVGLVTSNGPVGNNVMSAEWVHRVSSDPFLLAVCLNPLDATNENIKATNEFGVSLAAESHNVAGSIAGNYSGREVDKVKTLEELGVKFYKAEKINAHMVEGAAANYECKVVEHRKLGSHIMYIGYVVKASYTDANPIIYHKRKYYKIGAEVQKPDAKALEDMGDVVSKHRKD
jgi:flavin reductase (DIM6/NTAB) family NADH-FMN oxidoreductase RutF